MTQSNLSFLKKAPEEMPFKELISQRENLTKTIPLLDEESKSLKELITEGKRTLDSLEKGSLIDEKLHLSLEKHRHLVGRLHVDVFA